MKPREKKLEFVQLRAEGYSYSKIASELSISKDTCSKWEKEFKDEIALLKREQLQELYDNYYMMREARIKQLGGTLKRINEALSVADLEELSPDKLLDFKLKYAEALKGEYLELDREPIKDNFEAEDLLGAFSDVLNRYKDGSITPEQATKESFIIGNMLKAYDAVELKKRLEALEDIVGGR